MFENQFEIEELEEWKNIKQEFYSHNNNIAIVKVETLIKILLLMWKEGKGAFWEIENDLRSQASVRDYVGLRKNEAVPQAMALSYCYCRCADTIKNFEEKLIQLFETYQAECGFKTDMTAEEFVASDVTHINTPIYRSGRPYNFALNNVTDKRKRVCTGGCHFELSKEEKNYWDMSVTRKYKAKFRVKAPFMAATRMNMVSQSPAFPLGEVCGKYKSLLTGKEDEEGGLRTKGKYKKNTEQMPLVTFITIVYNREDTILRCMESVWAQNYPNVEYIVVDGKSNDGTMEIIKQHADKIDYYISQKDDGIYNAMNKGISLATGKFLCFMNSDDTCTPNAAESVVRCYKETQAKIVNGWIKLREEDGRIRNLNTVQRYLIDNNVMRYEGIYHQALYGAAEVFEEIGYFDETYRGASDLKWTNDCKNAGYRIELIDDILAVFSLGGFSGKNRFIAVDETCNIFQKEFPELKEELVKQLYYLYKRSGFMRRELLPALKKLKTYIKNNYSLRKWMYEISLYMLIEEAEVIIKRHSTERVSQTEWIKRKIKKKIKGNSTLQNIGVLEELPRILEEKLNQSLAEDKNEQKITVDDVFDVCMLKKIINSYDRKAEFINQYKEKYGAVSARYKYVTLTLREHITYGSLNRAMDKMERDYLEG